MKKSVATGTIVLALSVLALGCSTSTKEGASSTLTPLKQNDNNGGAKKEAAKLVVIRTNYGFQKGTPMEDKVHDLIQAKTGANVQMLFVPGDQIQNKINLMLSSKEQLDIIPGLGYNRALELYKSGAIIGLNKLIDTVAPGLKKNINPALWEEVTVDGEIIGIPSENNTGSAYNLQIRSDWLKNLNMQVPVTIADYEKVLDAFVNLDPAKTGKKDTIGMIANSGTSDISEFEQVFAPYFMKAGMAWYLDQNGNLVPPEMDPDYKNFLAKMAEWHKKGYIWKDFLTAKIDQNQEIVAQNKVGSMVGWYSKLYRGYEKLTKMVPEANYQMIMLQG
ncbi:MAG: extracellular solute-binding protein, partial [Paenibacillaceae bacterium]|nr:extracellular solute-binding protein [Paenibacillaceae bacterium]